MVNNTKQEKKHNYDYNEEAVKQTTTVKLNQLHCEICKIVDQKEVLVFDWRMVTKQIASIYVPFNLLSGSKTHSDLHTLYNCTIDYI
jgi:hypothetical protein